MDSQNSGKRRQRDFSPSYRENGRIVTRTGFLYLRFLGEPMIYSNTKTLCKSICLRSDKIYTIGRKSNVCEMTFEDRCISKRHCQVLFDGHERKIFIVDGFISKCGFDWNKAEESGPTSSLNGVFVNGLRVKRGVTKELFVGDEVLLACGSRSDHNLQGRIGFIVERIVYTEEIGSKSEIEKEKLFDDGMKVASGETCDASNVLVFRDNRISPDFTLCRMRHTQLVSRAFLLLSKYRRILGSVDPVSYIRKRVKLNVQEGILTIKNVSSVIGQEDQLNVPHKLIEIPSTSTPVIDKGKNVDEHEKEKVVTTGVIAPNTDTVLASEMANLQNSIYLTELKEIRSVCLSGTPLQPMDYIRNPIEEAVSNDKSMGHLNIRLRDCSSHSTKVTGVSYPSDGRKVSLNRLEFMDNDISDKHSYVSLPDIVFPVEGLLRIFIATFTSDILWFLSCCKVPHLLPITIACHNSERCWSGSHDKRTSTPYTDYPNLVVVYPPFPDSIAFGKDRKKKGIACHHPKLLVLQRDNSIRVVVTSANLVSRQWNAVTNTVWWQDFPRQSTPCYSSLFAGRLCGKANEGSKSDFAAQLAGFMACLLVDVPNEAHWIAELTKYDFGGAAGHLVASVPGVHVQNPSYFLEPVHVFPVKLISCSQATDGKFLGSIQTYVAGLKYRFHIAAGSHGAELKRLAALLGKCQEDAYGMAEVLLRRSTNIPADANAFRILVCDADEYSEGDSVQLGFLPKNIAKWVAPLYDAGFFHFSACIYPKEALAAALGGSINTVQLILYVSQGDKFSEIPRLIQPEHIVALCFLLASIQRCVGLCRLQEVLCQYKWPESLETDFVYGSSSIGTSVNEQFLAAFSAAVGKRSFQFSESEESDPEWGRWNASHELRSPSIKIIFPTIERVKNGVYGIWPSRCMLSFSERTWQRLRTTDILHDAIPHPDDRVGHPMHVKVARRRFHSKAGSSSFGWLYCGSHNFSRAAWGQPISHANNVNTSRSIASSGFGSRLHICNYELGIIFITPPPDTSKDTDRSVNLDDIALPFVVPAPKYQPGDWPATARAMRNAWTEVSNLGKEKSISMLAAEDLMDEELPEEEELVNPTDYVVEEEEEEAYAEALWSQVDSQT